MTKRRVIKGAPPRMPALTEEAFTQLYDWFNDVKVARGKAIATNREAFRMSGVQSFGDAAKADKQWLACLDYLIYHLSLEEGRHRKHVKPTAVQPATTPEQRE